MARTLNSSHKHWHPASLARLKAMWPKYSKQEIMKTFPGRSWYSIGQAARRTGARRARKFIRASTPTKDNLMGSLRHLREQRNLQAYKLGEMIGVTPKLIARYERGVDYPRLPILGRWCAALGVELTVKPVTSAWSTSEGPKALPNTIPVFRLNGEHKEAGE